MQLNLNHNIAVIVGGAQGIGLAIGREFAAEGARVVLVDRNARVEAAAQELPGKALGLVADVTDREAIERAAATVAAQYGRCEHLVYAAGVGSGKFGFPFWNVPSDDWPRVLAVNLTGAVITAQAFVKPMVEARRGTLLFISSVAGQIGSQTDPPYSAAKAGLINFSQCAAKDLAPHQVRVNTICPGMIQTALNRSVWEAWNQQQPPDQRQSYDDWAGDKVRRVSPLGRWQTPEEVAALAVFLASDRARNITGQTMNVDGGQVMHW